MNSFMIIVDSEIFSVEGPINTIECEVILDDLGILLLLTVLRVLLATTGLDLSSMAGLDFYD